MIRSVYLNIYCSIYFNQSSLFILCVFVLYLETTKHTLHAENGAIRKVTAVPWLISSRWSWSAHQLILCVFSWKFSTKIRPKQVERRIFLIASLRTHMLVDTHDQYVEQLNRINKDNEHTRTKQNDLFTAVNTVEVWQGARNE